MDDSLDEGVVDGGAEAAESDEARRRREYVQGPRPHPLTDMPPTKEGVSVNYILPNRDDLVFHAGEAVDVLCGVHNGGSSVINVTFAMASINADYDFSIHVQNFTEATYNTALDVGQEASFKYTFTPAVQLRPSKFKAAVTLFYEAEQNLYTDSFFNETFELIEKEGIDTELWLMVSSFIVILVGGIYFAYLIFVAPSAEKPKAVAPAPKPQVDDGDGANEWLKGTAMAAAGKAKKAKSGGAKKKSKR
jgi:hypothetical protein